MTELTVIRVQGGEQKAFELLVKQWQPRLLAYAKRTTGSLEAARDVLQDVWIAVSRSIRRLDSPEHFRGWIYRIVRNKCADWIRAEQARRRLATKMSETSQNPSTGSVPDEHPVGQIIAMLRTLPEERRTILTMFYLEELSIRDIGYALNIPEGTVKSRLYHARRMLKDALEN